MTAEQDRTITVTTVIEDDKEAFKAPLGTPKIGECEREILDELAWQHREEPEQLRALMEDHPGLNVWLDAPSRSFVSKVARSVSSEEELIEYSRKWFGVSVQMSLSLLDRLSEERLLDVLLSQQWLIEEMDFDPSRVQKLRLSPAVVCFFLLYSEFVHCQSLKKRISALISSTAAKYFLGEPVGRSESPYEELCDRLLWRLILTKQEACTHLKECLSLEDLSLWLNKVRDWSGEPLEPELAVFLRYERTLSLPLTPSEALLEYLNCSISQPHYTEDLSVDWLTTAPELFQDHFHRIQGESLKALLISFLSKRFKGGDDSQWDFVYKQGLDRKEGWRLLVFESQSNWLRVSSLEQNILKNLPSVCLIELLKRRILLPKSCLSNIDWQIEWSEHETNVLLEFAQYRALEHPESDRLLVGVMKGWGKTSDIEKAAVFFEGPLAGLRRAAYRCYVAQNTIPFHPKSIPQQVGLLLNLFSFEQVEEHFMDALVSHKPDSHSDDSEVGHCGQDVP